MKKRTFGIFAVVALAALVLVPAVALGCMKIQVPVSADQGGKVSAEVVYADKDTPIILDENTVSIGWTTVTATADAGYKFDKWIVACADKMKVQNGTSIKATFKQSQGISILKQPESVTVEKGKQAEFSVVAQGGSGKYTYQWKLNGKPLAGKTDAKLVIPAAFAKDEGAYTCTVTDKCAVCSSVTSDPAILKLASSAHKIIIESVGGNGVGTASPSSAVKGETVTLTATPADGFAFVKWQACTPVAIVNDSFVMPDCDVLIKAYFARAEYNIFYELNGGVLIEDGTYTAPRSYTYGEVVSLPTSANMVKNGVLFSGWYDNPECTGEVCLATKETDFGDKTYYAKWSGKPAFDIDKTPQHYVYNGTACAFEVKTEALGPTDGFTVEYRPTLTSEWTSEVPVNAGFYDVLVYRPESADYAEFEAVIEGGLVIERATITVTPITEIGGFNIAQKEYGHADPVLLYTYEGTVHWYEIPVFKGFLSREAGEDVGSYAINLGTLALADSLTFKASNYNLELAEGYFFTIYQYQKKVVVQVTGHAGTVVYNGFEQAVSGYEATTTDKLFNPAVDLTYDGIAEARGIDADTYPMGLTADKFIASPNFKEVNIELVADGCLVIGKAPQDPPIVVFVDESRAGASDGAIQGTTTNMEYRFVGSEGAPATELEWTQATDGEISGLKSGTYEIRYMESKNYYASAATVGTIGHGLSIEVTFDMGGHGTAPDTQHVDYLGYATRPAEDPQAEGFIFQGWFATVDGEYIEFPFETTALVEDITIYAEWCAYSVEVIGPVTADMTQLDKAAADFAKGKPAIDDLKLTLTVELLATSEEKEIAAYAEILGSKFVLYQSILTMTVNGVDADISKTNETLIPVTYTFDFAKKKDVEVWRLSLGDFVQLTDKPTEDGEFVTLDSKANEITTTVSKFGVYAFSYTESSEPSPDPVNPDTGDQNNTLLIVVGVIAAVAVAALVFAGVMRRRSR